MTTTDTAPTLASLRAARAVTLANTVSRLYLGRSLNLTETARLIDLHTVSAHVDRVTVYEDTVEEHRLAVITCAARHTAGAMNAGGNRLARYNPSPVGPMAHRSARLALTG